MGWDPDGTVGCTNRYEIPMAPWAVTNGMGSQWAQQGQDPWSPLHSSTLQPCCCPASHVWVQPGGAGCSWAVPAPPCRVHCAGQALPLSGGQQGAFVPTGPPGSRGWDTEIKAWAVGCAATLRSCCCYGVYCWQLSPRALHPTPCFSLGEQ